MKLSAAAHPAQTSTENSTTVSFSPGAATKSTAFGVPLTSPHWAARRVTLFGLTGNAGYRSSAVVHPRLRLAGANGTLTFKATQPPPSHFRRGVAVRLRSDGPRWRLASPQSCGLNVRLINRFKKQLSCVLQDCVSRSPRARQHLRRSGGYPDGRAVQGADRHPVRCRLVRAQNAFANALNSMHFGAGNLRSLPRTAISRPIAESPRMPASPGGDVCGPLSREAARSRAADRVGKGH